jgi:hypothetical protein
MAVKANFGPKTRRPGRIYPKNASEPRKAGDRRKVMPVVLHHKRESLQQRRNS